MSARKHIDPSTQVQIVMEPFDYLAKMPGKGIRSQLLEAFHYWIPTPKPALVVIARVVNLLHTSSLMIDDIEDDSDLRRGSPACHKVFGIPSTINSANYVYFEALRELMTLKDMRMITIFSEEMLLLHQGQGMDLHHRDTVQCPSEEQFIDMVKNKTGGLFRMAIRLMIAATSANESDYIPLVDALSVHFQIRDDYMNLQSREYADAKGFCEDITEGKFSFPVIHCIHSDPHNRQLLNILKQRTLDIDLKKHALGIMAATGSLAYTVDFLQHLELDIRAMIEGLGGNSRLDAIVDYLSLSYQKVKA